MDKPTHITQEDLQTIQSAKANAAYMKAVAEKTLAQAKTAEVECKNVILTAFMKYNLTPADSIENDGSIVRVNIVAVKEEEAK